MSGRAAEGSPLARLPVSAAQHGVWVAQRLDPQNPRYNCGGYLEILGELDVGRLATAVRRAVAETEALRVRFVEDAGGVWQVLEAAIEGAVEIIDLRGAAAPLATAETWMRADLLRPLDLGAAPLFTHVLFPIAADRSLFYFRYHHIVMDGFAQILYWRRVAELYTALEHGGAPSAGASPLTALLAEDAAYRASPQFERDRAHWLAAMADQAEPAQLAGRAVMASRGLLRRSTELVPASAEALRAAARRDQTRWSVIAIATAAAYLHRLTGAEDVVLGLPVSSRLTPAARVTPCMMANELPLRLHVRPATSVGELLRQVTVQIGQVLKHQRYRGEELHRELRQAGSEGALPGLMVNIVSFDHPIVFAGNRTIAHHLSSGPVRDLLIAFYGNSDGGELEVHFDANPELYGVDDVAVHQRRFLALLDRVAAADLGQRIGELDLLLPGERALVDGYNATDRPYDLSRCLHELIDQQARRSPDAIAVAVEGEALSYRELVDRADRLAAHLRGRGVAPGHHVGVCEHRSLELMVSLVAVLKAGAAYVPLDPDLPAARLEFQLRDAGIAVVLSRGALLDRLAGSAVETIAVDQLLATLPPAAPAIGVATPEHTAYVIYTSGSTGQPKGVAVPHRGVVNRLLWMQDEYRLDAGDCVLQKTPFTFDVSVWELFWPLLVGSKLFLAAPGGHRDPCYLIRTICTQGVTTLHFVPPMLDLFLAEPDVAAAATHLRRVMCSGEALGAETVRSFFARFPADRYAVELHNLYGPTEASIDVTSWACRPEDAAGAIPIGRPVANTRIYLLDRGGQLAPPGVVGELYIGGVQVASGYLNRPELTRERFLPDPFGPRAGAALYRTGDLARYRTDGALEFLGRIDHQVKLRGFRIELGEIEVALRAHPAIEQAVVTVWQRGADRRLVAYVVGRGADAPPGQDELAGFLAAQLPDYMVPAHVVALPALPLSANGKLDRRALPTPAGDGAGDGAPDATAASSGAPPVTADEQLLHEVWREILGLHRFGTDDSFFALGGDSMLAIRVRTAVEQRGRVFAIEALFRHPTIRELARQLTAAADATAAHIAPFGLVRAEDRARLPAGLDDAYPLSAMQTGMLFHADYDDGTAVYRVVTSLHIAAELDLVALCGAIADTFRRHPALRSSFDLASYSEPLQLVHREVEVPVDLGDDLGGLDDAAAQQWIDGWIERAKFHRFDPAVPPLVRFTAHPRGAAGFQLSVVEHHVVLDGWSDTAMLDEIVRRYRARRSGQELWLPAVASRHVDFIAEERRVAASPASREFWTAALRGAAAMPLPRRFAAGVDASRAHQQAHHVAIPTELAERLRRLARGHGLPLKALLATAHLAVLRLVTGTDEVVSGVVANGRLEEAGGDEVIGVFLNTLPLRIDTAGATLIELARRVFAHERASAPHRRYPFAHIQRDLGGELELDSYVNFMDFHRRWQTDGAAGAAIVDGIGVAETNYPLAVNFLVDPVQSRLRLWLDCDLAVLDPELCIRLTGYYRRALEAIAMAPELRLAEIDLRDDAERDRVARWNATATAYDATVTIASLIEAQVRRSPTAIAVAHRSSELSYATLEGRANQLARHLVALGVGRGSRVGVKLRRGPDLVAALYGVLKAGAAYVPLDPSFPRNRLEFIIADAAIDALITDRAGGAAVTVGRVVLVDGDAARIAAQPTTALVSEAGGDDPAYVIYTSGSTGQPKGTVVRHRNVANFFAGMDARIGCGAGDVVLAVTSVSFDISVLELLWPLTRGAKVVVASERLIENLVPDDSVAGFDPGAVATERAERDPRAEADDSFAGMCERHAVTLLQSTPSFLAAVITEPAALVALAGARAVLVGGEAFPAGLAERLATALPATRLFNMYGPTETTIWSTVHELDTSTELPSGTIPIGTPIANTEVMILDGARRPVPIGVAGELWIGGDGVAAGYLGQPELTAERFPAHPAGRGQIYRTGDRARWRSDGAIEFLGRVDRQVKIRGHRVEPDEVESVLSRHPHVASVAVVAVKRDGGHELVAFVAAGRELADRGAEAAHVARWGQVWDGAYGDPDPGGRAGDPDHDFAGWKSSYTQEPIPAAEMREWLGHTLERITDLAPRSVIDVGVGVGLMLRALAPRVTRYHGLDVSAAALRAAAASVAQGDGSLPAHVTLALGDGSALAELPAGAADTVILSSVVQYFPGTEYLEHVLEQALRVVGSDGAVYIGDVRDLDLLAAFHASVQLHRAPALTPARELAATVARQIASERELCLSTHFFRDLAARLAGRGIEVRIESKRGHAINELTSFRYDVTLLGAGRARGRAGARSAGPEVDVRPWSVAITGGDLEAAVARLAADRSLTVTGIPDRRRRRPLALLPLLDAPGPTTTAWDVERTLWEIDDDRAVDPEALVALGARLGRRVRLNIPVHGRPGELDADFGPKEPA
jgi:amino acid adenylation domain-containing protein